MDSTSKAALVLGGGVLGLIAIAIVLRPKAQAASRPMKIGLIGDSLAAGLAPELTKIYGDALRGEAHGGTSTKQWADHDKACGQCGDWLANFKPDVTLVVLGTNDGGMAYANSYQTIRDDIQALGSAVIWVEPPTMPNRSMAAVRSTIRSLGVKVIPEFQIPLTSDGIHPSGAGYALWAKKIAENV